MKRLALTLVLCLTALALTACGGRNREKAPAEAQDAPQASAAAAQTEPAAVEAALLSNEEVMALVASQGYMNAPAEGVALPADAAADADRPVDLDLTRISGTVAYSQVYDMLMEPEVYTGQKVKLKGKFSYFQDPDTKREYFAAVIADAMACCTQGIEFVWKGEHSYPRDYPPLDTEIIVTGTFQTYREGDSIYVQLTDADVRW